MTKVVGPDLIRAKPRMQAKYRGPIGGVGLRTGTRGENHPRAKLTAAHVREIRRLHAEENVRPQCLRKLYDISSGHLSHILNRDIWRDT